VPDFVSVLVNVSTGQTIEIDRTNYVHMPIQLWPAFDPTLTRVVFHQDPDTVSNMALMDIQTGNILWSVQMRHAWTYAQWSPDGSKFVAAVPLWVDSGTSYQLFVVDCDGHAQQVTFFTDLSSDNGVIMDPQWSPDQHYISYWYKGSLTVFDMVTRVSTDYCLPSAVLQGSEAVFWSSDSRQIAFDESDDFFRGFRSIVLDIPSGRAVQLSDTLFTAGWMTTSP
jgi:hypothetical protein